jgi:hypothetical protein
VSTIPLADAPALAPYARVTTVVRLTLGAIVVVSVVAALLVSRHPHTRSIVPETRTAQTIVVLDVSASISSDTYSRIGGTLASLARGGGRLGLVVFSDQAYEALPPGTRASDLEPLVRYFTLPKQTRPGFAPTFPPNPWQSSFTAGTKISAGMELAHSIALADRRHPATVVLVSDLEDDPADVTRLASVLLAYRRDRVPVRIVALDPASSNVAFFRRLLQPAPAVVEAPTLAEGPPRDTTPFPWPLVALALAAAAALAVHERWAPRLQWGRG